MLYDRDRDAVITIDKVSEVFSDRNLANGLFERLDIEGLYYVFETAAWLQCKQNVMK